MCSDIMEAAPPPPTGWRRRTGNVLLCVLFSTALILPLCRFNAPGTVEHIEQVERRKANPFPTITMRKLGPIWRPSLASVNDFPSRLTQWFNDHVGFRKQLIGTYNIAKYYGLTPASLARAVGSSAAADGVVVGRNGWLFYNGGRILEDFRCTSPFTTQELQHWKAVLEARRQWLARQGIHYVLLIGPNAQTIYPEYMPRKITRVGKQSRFDQLLAELQTVPGFDVIDVRDQLCKASQQYPTYFRTDTHWNQYGAFIGYQGLMNSLVRACPDLQPLTLSDFNIRQFDVDVSEGDLAKMLNSPIGIPDVSVNLQPKREVRVQVVDTDLPSVGTIARIATCGSGQAGTAVVFHDSFFNAIEPYFNTHWSRVHYVHTADFPAEVVTAEHPRVVVQEIVERQLMAPVPTNPPEVDRVLIDRLAHRPGSRQ